MNSGCRNLEKAPISNAALVVPKASPPTKFPSRAAAQQTQSLFCKTTSLSFFSAQAVLTPETMEVWHNGGGSRAAELAYYV